MSGPGEASRLDPRTGRIRHFGEGLASEFVSTALRDAQGRLWFGISGVLRLGSQRTARLW